MASFEQSNINKTWSVRFRVIEGGKEKNKRLSGYKTKKEANQAYVDFMASYIPEKIIDENDVAHMTFNQVFAYYFKDAKLRVKPSTAYVISHDFEQHIKPKFGEKKFFEIKKRDIIDWQNGLTEKGYAYKYKCKIRGFLSSIYTFAVKYLDYPLNLVTQCPTFTRQEPKKEMNIWSLDEFNQFIEKVDDPVYHALFNFMYYTGCRKGEALAVSWNDLDPSSGMLTINKNLSRKTEGQAFIVTTPKNESSNRKILLPKTIVSELKQLHEQRTSDTFMFGGVSPLSDNTVARKFKYYAELAGVKSIRIHDLRHSHASLLISRGASIVLVAKRLGHSNVEQTLNTYSHLMPNDEQSIVKLLE